jgi:hypothetical protein
VVGLFLEDILDLDLLASDSPEDKERITQHQTFLANICQSPRSSAFLTLTDTLHQCYLSDSFQFLSKIFSIRAECLKKATVSSSNGSTSRETLEAVECLLIKLIYSINTKFVVTRDDFAMVPGNYHEKLHSIKRITNHLERLEDLLSTLNNCEDVNLHIIVICITFLLVVFEKSVSQSNSLECVT